MIEAATAAFTEAPEENPDLPSLETLHACLDRLSLRARELITLRHLDGLDTTTIASRIGWTEPAVRVALSKARKNLEECLRRHAARQEAEHG